MSVEKNTNARIQHKHDIEANWSKATNFIPKAGELVIYDADENYTYARIKIGDGVTAINDLGFIDETKADKKDVIAVEGGGALTLQDIFGEPPYTIEVTDELEELSNITVATGADYETYRLRNVAILTEVPTIMNDGDIALVIRKEG